MKPTLQKRFFEREYAIEASSDTIPEVKEAETSSNTIPEVKEADCPPCS